MDSFSSIGDLISGKKTGAVSDLFSRTVSKPAPAYDYSVVPQRINLKKKREEEDEEDEDDDQDIRPIKKKTKKELRREEKERKRKLREAAAAVARGTAGKTAVTGEGEKPLSQAANLLKEKIAKVEKEDSKEKTFDPERESRTVFVGNVPVTTKKKALRQLFSEHGEVEAVRFRSAARPDLKTTKKVAVIKQTFHEARTNINAYIRFSTVEGAEKSCALNGTELEGHVIRVDMSLGSVGKVHDQHLAVFLGNLDFKTSEDDVRQVFSKCGDISNVRLVRDSSTGIGKGFGYVNFESRESVENALRLNAAEVCGRKVRVGRAVRKPKAGNSHLAATGNSAQWGHRKNPGKKNNFRESGNRGPPAGNKRFPTAGKKAVWSKGSKTTEKRKSFQGVSTDRKQFKKPRLTKTEKKHKIVAEKLAS